MVVVVGMGRSGLAVSRLLKSTGTEVWATDSNPAPALEPEFERVGVRTETGRHSAEAISRAEEIVVSPGVPLDIPALVQARDEGVHLVSELEVASRHLAGDVVAITGSNGKTTTTSLVAHILGAGARPVQVGGNIGTAVSDLVASSSDQTINVVEVSSFQLDTTHSFRPRIGLLLNVTPDHLDRYPSFKTYRDTKFKLFRNQTAEDFAIFNQEDPQTFPLPETVKSRQLFFSGRETVNPGAGFDNGVLSIDGREVLSVDEVPLRGAHNVENVLAAILVGGIYGMNPEVMARRIRTFEGVEHRLETVAVIDGVEFVNDSKATNVDSAVKAVEAFEGNIVLIVGGKDKGASFRPLIEAMSGRVRQTLTIGASAEKFEAELGGMTPVKRAKSVSDAVELAIRLSRHGDVVLLAPACSSFDMYSSYEERGLDFKNAVRAHERAATVSEK